MVTDPVFFRDLAYVFVAAVLGGALARVTHQPLILGYVVGGVLISPLTPGPAVTDIHTFELFAEIGVILLMFSIGIEFSLRDLLRVKWVAILGGPLGIVLSTGLGVAVGALMGWPLLQGAVIGMVISVASTMVLARLLIDRGELHTRHGRVMIGLTLVEDLAVVVLIVLLPRLGAWEPERLLALAGGLGLSIAILAPFLYLAAKVVPRVLTRVARTHSEELFMLVALAIALGSAAATQAAGLSLALGAFLAGLLISESDYAHETLARLLPIRDAFVALFFVTVGALINPAALVENVSLLGAIVALVVLGKLVIWTVVVRVLGHPLLTAVLVGVGLTQIGEFSFVLIQVARGAGHVGADVHNAILAASLLTILSNAALVRWVPQWIGRAARGRWGRLATVRGDADLPPEHVVLCGFGRVGSAVAEALETFGVRYVAIETDPDIVKSLRDRGTPAVFGDASRPRILEAAGAGRAPLAIVTVPEIEHALLAVRALRTINSKAPILARAHHPTGRDRLAEAGATEVIQPEVEAASTLIRHALRQLAMPRESVLAYLERYRSAMDAGPEAAAGPPGPLPQVRELVVGAGALADQSLREAHVRERFGVTVVALDRPGEETVMHPSAETVLRPGDRVHVFGLPEQVARLEQALSQD
jgi:CPA2 family monovalent cation:H+ antiporter-2